ncbi:MAG: hypothetical protein HOH34_08965 [Flavobacteriales bacterium]|jgi:hypothetical protein|nr:hypothetical protein [Flavobacteriales bacterium]MDO7610531.1 hypothetical protein [Crocinitomicaceae bacterium]
MFQSKILLLIPHLFLCFIGYTQQSENIVPKEASTVFSINNINLLKKISLNELVKYDFMEEIHQELFDGSTEGKTLKDAGMDFDQRLNVFYGKNDQLEVSGFSFGVSDKLALFEVFDDFEAEGLISNSAEKYASFFNTLIIENNAALLIRVEPRDQFVTDITDSIWYARGNENPFGSSLELDLLQEPEEFYEDDMHKLYNSDFDLEKNYWEIRDSILYVLQVKNLEEVLTDLFLNKNSLYSEDPRFAQQVSRSSEGVFYLDNSRNITNEQGLWYFQTMYPIMNDDLKELYKENIMLGDLSIDSNEINFTVNANYGQELGSIYSEMNNNKINKKFLKYIPDNSPAYVVYNIDIRKAYEKAYDIVLPILKSQKNVEMVMNIMAIQLLDQLVDKKSFFGAYKGGMFASFNGVEKVKVNQVEYVYDEENFDYSEIEIESEEEIPVFTIGFASQRPDLFEMILEDLSRLSSRIQKKEGYWIVEDAILDATPVYLICNKNTFIISNNRMLVESNLEGYGAKSLSGKKIKRLKKSGVLYASVDLDETFQKIPFDFLDERQKNVIDRMKGKSGRIELTSGNSELDHTKYKMTYSFEQGGDSGKQFLDIINSLYIFSK